MELDELKRALREFSRERNWDQYHTPKNIIMALTGEVGELAEIFQWLSEDEAANLDSNQRTEVSQELADILIYLVRLSDILNIDLDKSIWDKIELNRKKYPVEVAFDNAIKYNKRDKE